MGRKIYLLEREFFKILVFYGMQQKIEMFIFVKSAIYCNNINFFFFISVVFLS